MTANPVFITKEAGDRYALWYRSLPVWVRLWNRFYWAMSTVWSVLMRKPTPQEKLRAQLVAACKSNGPVTRISVSGKGRVA